MEPCQDNTRHKEVWRKSNGDASVLNYLEEALRRESLWYTVEYDPGNQSRIILRPAVPNVIGFPAVRLTRRGSWWRVIVFLGGVRAEDIVTYEMIPYTPAQALPYYFHNPGGLANA